MRGLTRQESLRLGALMALSLPAALVPASFSRGVRADEGKDEARGKNNKGREDKNDEKERDRERKPVPAPQTRSAVSARQVQQPPVQPVQPAPASPVHQTTTGQSARGVTPQGTERMVSETVRLHGSDGSGAGPIRIDLAQAQANSVYDVTYLPTSEANRVVSLGTIRTSAQGTFTGETPVTMPSLEEAARSGVLVLQRRAP